MKMDRPGFTIIELIVVLAVFAIAAATTLPFLGSFQQRETIAVISENIVRELRTAQQMAMAGERDGSWGVRFEPGSYITYTGVTYATRHSKFDRRHVMPKALVFRGMGDINFLNSTGKPAAGSGTLTLSMPEGQSAVITINAAGGVFLEKQQ